MLRFIRLVHSPLSRRGSLAVRRSPPFPVAPRRQPGAAGRQPFRHGIKPMASPRVAAAKPGESHDAAGPEPVPGNRFIRIGRARGQIAAVAADKSGKAQLIGADRIMRSAAGGETKVHQSHDRHRAGRGKEAWQSGLRALISYSLARRRSAAGFCRPWRRLIPPPSRRLLLSD